MSHPLTLSAPYHLCGVDYTVSVPPDTLTKTQYYRIIGHEKFRALYERKMLNGLNILYLKLGYVDIPTFEYWTANILPEDMKKAENWLRAEEKKKFAEKKVEQEARYRLQKEKFENAVEDKLQRLRVAERENELSSLFSR